MLPTSSHFASPKNSSAHKLYSTSTTDLSGTLSKPTSKPTSADSTLSQPTAPIKFFQTIPKYEKKFLSENTATYTLAIQDIVSDFTDHPTNQIKLQDINPYNPDKAYRISAENSWPKINPLTLHIKKNDPINSERLEKAQRVFFQGGLGVPR